MDWPFHDPPNVAVFTSADILEREEWIYFVGHDDDDGAWQFLPYSGAPLDEKEARICSLQSILSLDQTIAELADLPYGWCAWREAPEASWQRQASA